MRGNMMKNKLLMILLIILVSITLVGVVAVVIIDKYTGEGSAEKAPSIEEIVEASVDIPEVTTNLASGDFIRMAFTIQTDSKKAKKELEQRNFQVNNIIITELSEMKEEELTGKKGKEKFQASLKEKISHLMQDGKVEQVYITSSILQ